MKTKQANNSIQPTRKTPREVDAWRQPGDEAGATPVCAAPQCLSLTLVDKG